MGKLLGLLFLFCFGMWFVVELLGLLIDVLLAIWPILFIVAILIPAGWLCIKLLQNRKKEKADIEDFRIFPDLDAFTDKVSPRITGKKQTPEDLTTLMEEEGHITITTKQQLQEFYDSHVLLRSFITKVVGVSYPNDDGTSRQEILSHCLTGEPVGLHWYAFRGAPACAVISDYGQIGHLKAELAAELHEAYIQNEDDTDIIFSSAISDITGGQNGLSYGCNITMSIYASKPKENDGVSETRQSGPGPTAVPVLPPPDATDWNTEIPVEELTGLLAQRPFYDNYLMRCTPDGRKDLPERFSDLSKFVILDIETTGLNPQRARIIEVAAVKFENFQITGTFATLINPLIALPRRITELTGITQAELRTAPPWQEKQEELLEFIDGYTLVGHNLAGFDIRFLNNAIGEKLPNPLIDTLEYSRTVFPDLPRHKLSYLKHVLGIDVKTSHRALDDVKTTFFLLAACMRQEDSMEPIYSNMDVLIAENTNTYVPPIPPKKVKLSDIPPIAVNADPNNPLYGKRIVFTGELSIPREQAMRLAAEQGAILRTAVSGKTDFLIVGQQDIAVVGTDGMSTKEEKAHLLNDLGKAHIQIIDEAQFREMAGIAL